MSDRSGSLVLAACLALVFAARAAAQPSQPIVAPAPAAPEFLTRYDFHLTIASLMPKHLDINLGIDASAFVTQFRTAQALLGNPEPATRPRRALPGQRVLDHDE